jgi:hypothetical protein
MIAICILTALIIYIVWGSIYMLKQINRINDKFEETSEHK